MCPPPHAPQHAHPPPQHHHHPPPEHHHQPPPYYYPNPYGSKPPRRRSSCGFASCFLATAFLVLLALAGTITCFILFRPQDPLITVTSVRFPTFTATNGTANFTFFQIAAVRNPNRYDFSHYDSSLSLLSAATGPVGQIYIPAATIAGGRTQYLSATFDVKSFPVPAPVAAEAVASGPVQGIPGPTAELETMMKLAGTVKVMRVFAHHVEKTVHCRVTIQVSDGSVLGYHC